MQTAGDHLADLWTLAGGEADALDRVKLTGDGPTLPSSFAVATAAQVSIAASGLAAAQIHAMRTGEAQTVSVDREHATVECRSERYLSLDGKPPPPAWDAIAGVYKVRDGYVRLHTNFLHHRDNVCKVLNCKPKREDVQAALSKWNGEAFETAAYSGGCVVSFMRPYEVWKQHPHAQALADLPVLTTEKIGDAPPKLWPKGERPLSGIRMLDLSHVIAAPVAGRTFAAHGADVMLIYGPNNPTIPWLVIDTGRGKLSTTLDLKTTDGKAEFRKLLSEADVISQGYRPGAMDALGFSPAEAAAINPGIVYVSLCAYGHVGPWASRRGFDSLVQTTTGFNHGEAQAAGVEGPKELPMQILDHATGYLMAFGAMMAKARQAREGGSWHVRVSLAQTGRWIWNMGRIENGLATPEPSNETVARYMQRMPSGFGELNAVKHSAVLSKTPAEWVRPSVPLGTHSAVWPARS